MSWGRRVVRFPLVRIVLAAAPIVALLVGTMRLGPARPFQPALLGVAVLLVYAGYVRLVERRRVEELSAHGATGEVARGFVVGAALFATTMGVLWLLGVASVERGDGWRALLVGLAAALGAAMIEETLLRAIFFRIVEESLGTFIALLLSAALFGVLHAPNPGATVVSTVAIALEAGVLLAAAFVYTRRLWMAMGLHAAWNFSEGGLFGASVSGTRPSGLLLSHFRGPAILSGGAFGPEASIVAIVVCLAAGIALTEAARRRGGMVPRPGSARAGGGAPFIKESRR